jgi:hypothetical protein
MEITRELIQKFFENKCDPDEFEAVMNYWQNHPEQAEQDLGIKEWNEIDPVATVPDNNQVEMLENNRAEMLERPLSPIPSGPPFAGFTLQPSRHPCYWQ